MLLELQLLELVLELRARLRVQRGQRARLVLLVQLELQVQQGLQAQLVLQEVRER